MDEEKQASDGSPEEQPPGDVQGSKSDRMKFVDRQTALSELAKLRPGRLLVSLFNLDRQSIPSIQGLSTQFDASVKEPLYRVLKESFDPNVHEGIDLFLYTRGGDTNAVWPIVNLIREFDENFEVLVPFRCHSSGTLLTLGARRIVMGPLSELSPIDPTCGNKFNPSDPADPAKKLGISVEDVQAYRDFLLDQLKLGPPNTGSNEVAPDNWREIALPLVEKLTDSVHPLAIGNVYRVIRLIEQLANQLLAFHASEDEDSRKIVNDLTTHFFSHTHMLDRHEATKILGARVNHADEELSEAMDKALSTYKQSFKTWEPFFWIETLADNLSSPFEFVGGIVETTKWSYLYRTSLRVTQTAVVPQGVNIQVPPGQPIPLVAGLPRNRTAEIVRQGWTRNEHPTGVTT